MSLSAMIEELSWPLAWAVHADPPQPPAPEQEPFPCLGCGTLAWDVWCSEECREEREAEWGYSEEGSLDG